MRNVLLTADYHIHDYRAHNLFDDPKFRLNQFVKLTDRLIEIVVETKCEAVIIAGDVLHVASPRPYVVNFARTEIGRLAQIVPVYMTNGQHEYDSRTNMTGEHTLLQVFNDIPNVHYIQEGREVIGGATFQFCGWTPEQDLTHIQPADVLIGHATVLNAKITQGNTIITHGQDFDASKFKLCVMGDIHRHQQLGNILIPGVPIQHCFVGSTKVFLADGSIRTMKDLYESEETDLFVYSSTLDGEVKISKSPKVNLTKYVSELVEVNIDGEVIRCTPEHEFLTVTGQYIQAQDLKEGDSLMPLYKSWSDQETKIYYSDSYERVSSFNKNWSLTHWLADDYNVRNKIETLVDLPSIETHRHHKNHNSLDNRPTNIERRSKGDHGAHHLIEAGVATRFTSESMKERWDNLSDEELKQIQEDRARSASEQWKDPEIRAKMTEGIRKNWENISEEDYKSHCETSRATFNKMWSDPEYEETRRKIAEGASERCKTISQEDKLRQRGIRTCSLAIKLFNLTSATQLDHETYEKVRKLRQPRFFEIIEAFSSIDELFELASKAKFNFSDDELNWKERAYFGNATKVTFAKRIKSLNVENAGKLTDEVLLTIDTSVTDMINLYGSLSTALEASKSYQNHSVLSVTKIKLDNSEPVYDVIDVEEFSNFAISLTDSSGVFVHNSFGDHHDVGVCILDTTTLEWTRVPTIVKGKWDFLQLITTNDTHDGDDYVVTKPLPTADGKTVGDVHKSLDIHEIIEKCIEESGLRGVHAEVLQRYQVNTDKSIDMKFFLMHMKIQNYQSIDSLEFNFQDGITVINGLNGTGKSTLVNAIRACLTGEWSPRDDVTINEPFVELDLTLNYQGINYRIVRGWENNGYLNFYIGDLENKIETENQTATKDRIIQSLPFTKPEYMKLMFHDQTRPKFLSSYNYAGRVDLVTNLLGLHVVEDYQAIATDLRRVPAEQISKLGIDKGGLTVFVQSAVVGDTSLGQIDEYVAQLTVHKDLFNKIKAISTEKSKISQIVSEINLNNNMITKSTYDPRDALLEIPNVDTLKAEKLVIEQDLLAVNNEIGQVSNELSQARNAVNNAERDITTAKTKLGTLVVGNCYTCSSPLNEDKVIDLRKTLDEDVSKHSSTVVLINMSVETLNNKLTSLNQKRDQLSSRKDELVSEIANSDSIRLRKDNAIKMQNQVKFLEDNNNALNLRKLEHESTITIALNVIPDEFKTEGQLNVSESSVQEKISGFESKIHTINAMKELSDKVNRAKSDIANLDQKIAEHQAIVDNYDAYIKLMSPKGVVIHSVLSKISELWTNDQFLIKAYKTKVNGETSPDFSMSYFNGKFWVSYEKCSGGQKVVCDLYLLNCLISLIGGVGFLIFDETFKEADHPNLTNIVELLKETSSNSTMIISHELNFPYNDHLVTTSFENGLTTYNLIS